jgi:YidC/Oxa1 family membrane protein insertase
MGVFQAWSGWRRYRKLSADWHNIVIYSEGGQDWHYFESLVKSLNTDMRKKVTYVTSDTADPGLNCEHDLFKSICIPEGFFLTLHFNMQKADVVVLTMMDLDNLQLKKSINPVHYIYLFHSLGSTHMVDHANSYDAYDSLFCVGPHQVAELRKRESMQGLKARNLFEYGHPRLESLLSAAESYQRGTSPDVSDVATKPVVLIAPTWGEQSIFNTCGDELTGLLLDAGYHVIARPHYQTLQLTPEVVDKLRARYGDHVNFEYQDSMGESDTLFRSDILICDWSAMAIEYALGLEKPVLFVDLPRRIRNPDWQALGIEPREASFRELAGDIVSPQHLDEVPEKIAGLLEKRQEFRQTMMHLRPQMVFNIGNSIELGAREIARLADEKALERQTREQAHA